MYQSPLGPISPVPPRGIVSLSLNQLSELLSAGTWWKGGATRHSRAWICRQEIQSLVSGAGSSGASLLSGIGVGQLQRTPLGDWS